MDRKQLRDFYERTSHWITCHPDTVAYARTSQGSRRFGDDAIMRNADWEVLRIGDVTWTWLFLHSRYGLSQYSASVKACWPNGYFGVRTQRHSEHMELRASSPAALVEARLIGLLA